MSGPADPYASHCGHMDHHYWLGGPHLTSLLFSSSIKKHGANVSSVYYHKETTDYFIASHICLKIL